MAVTTKKKRRDPLSWLGAKVAGTIGWDPSSWPQPNLTGEGIAATIRRPITSMASRMPYLPPSVTGFPVGIGTPPSTPATSVPPLGAGPAPQWGVPAAPAGARRLYKPTPNLRSMVAGAGATPESVGLRPGQQLPGPYAQMIAGRGYAEPVSPLGTFQRREAAATVPGANPPILYSPATEAKADQIMAEERARWAAQVRAPGRVPGVTQSWTSVPGQAPTAGYGQSLPPVGVEPIGNRFGGPLDALGRVATTSPTRLAPRGPEPETPDQALRRRMVENYPGLAERESVQSMLTDEPLGRFAPAFTATLPEYTQAMTEYRDALARGESPEYPGSYRGLKSAAIDPKVRQAMLGQLPKVASVTPEQRQAKRREEMGIRSMMREGKRTGQPMTRGQAEMMATIRGKMKRGEALTPDDIGFTWGPQAREQALQEPLQRAQIASQAIASIAGMMKAGETLTPQGRKDLEKLLAIVANPSLAGGAGGGGAVGGAGARGLAASGGGMNLTPDQVKENAIGELEDIVNLEVPAEIATDAAAAERYVRTQMPRISEAALDEWGRRRFGDYDWQYRNWGYLNPRAVIPGGAGMLFPKEFFSSGGRKRLGIKLPGFD